MIQLQSLPQQAQAWQHELRHSFGRPIELLRHLELDPQLPVLEFEKLRDFPLRVPRGFAALMRKGDPRDPLFLQVWPRPEESLEVPGYSTDAVGDLATLKDGGIIHKYHGRALVVATGACGVHCRYCFRRHFPYSEALAARDQWRGAIEALRSDSSISEVILSGGDPLSLSDDKLASFVEALEGIPHVRRLRLHSRQPVVLPERVDSALLGWLAASRLQKVMVLHANHANELDERVSAACARLGSIGVTLLNQSVLLRGVNDDADALAALSERLFSFRVLPYYLHMLDRVHGSAHFEVGEIKARALMRELSARLPGYLLPRLAQEVPGESGKRVLAW